MGQRYVSFELGLHSLLIISHLLTWVLVEFEWHRPRVHVVLNVHHRARRCLRDMTGLSIVLRIYGLWNPLASSLWNLNQSGVIDLGGLVAIARIVNVVGSDAKIKRLRTWMSWGHSLVLCVLYLIKQPPVLRDFILNCDLLLLVAVCLFNKSLDTIKVSVAFTLLSWDNIW